MNANGRVEPVHPQPSAISHQPSPVSLYHSTDANGVSEISPPAARLRELIELLDDAAYLEHDHPDLSLVHDPSGWSLTLHPNGTVVWENLDAPADAQRILSGVSRNRAYELWLLLSHGEIERIEAEDWRTL